MDRLRRPSDDVWDEIALHFGHPRTKTEQAMFGKVVTELMGAGVTVEEVTTTCIYVLARFDNPSILTLPKWLSSALREAKKPQLSPQQTAIAKLREAP